MLKRFLSVFLPVTLVFAGVTWFIYKGEIQSAKALIESQEVNHVKFQAKAITAHFQNVISDLEILSELHELKQLADGKHEYSPGELHADFISISSRKGLYDQIRLIDAEGMEIVRVNYNSGGAALVPKDLLQDKSDRYYFKEAVKLEKDETYISPLDLNVEEGEVERPFKPMIRFGLPIISSSGQTKGVLILNFLAQSLLKDYKAISSDSPGRNSLLNSDGYWFSSGDPAEEWGFMFDEGKSTTFGAKHPEAWKTISVEDSGQFYGPAGLYTFTTIYPALVANEMHQGMEKLHDFSESHARKNYWKTVSFISQEALQHISAEKRIALLKRLLGYYAAIVVLTGAGAFLLAMSVSIRKKAEEELRATEEKNRLILESTAEAKYGVDLNGICMWVNPACVTILGYESEEDLLGKKMHELVHHTRKDGSPYPVEQCRIRMSTLNQEGAHADDEVFWKADDSSFQVEYWSHPIRREDEILGVVVSFVDITERKRAEEALKVNEETLAKAQEIAHIGSWDWHITKNTLAWSDEIYRIFGLKPQEFTATYEAFLEMVHPGDRDSVTAAVNAAVNDDAPYSIEHRIVLKNGSFRTVHERGIVYRDESGAPTRMVGTVHDITERKEAEEAVRLSGEKFRNLFESANDGIFIIDVENAAILNVNEIGAARLGFTQEEIIEKKVFELYFPEDAENNKQAFEQVKKEGNAVFESRQRRKDGSALPVEISSRLVDYEGRKVAQSFVRDTTARKRIEAALMSANRHLKALSEASEFITHTLDEKELLEKVCRIIVDTGGYRMAWVGFSGDGPDKKVTPMAQAGFDEGYLGAIKVTWDDEPTGQGPMGSAIRTKELYVVKNCMTDERFAPWRDDALSRGYISVAGLPLIYEGSVIGALAVYSSQRDAFTSNETALLANLAENLAFGIMFIRERMQRKQAQEELQEAHQSLERRVEERTAQVQKLTRAIDQSDEMVIITDTDGVIEYANPSAEKVTGWAPEELVGKLTVIFRSGKNSTEFYQAMWSTILQGALWSGNLINRKKSGELYHEEMTISPMKDNKGTVTHFVAIKRDISKRIREAEELKLAKDQAEQANKAKSAFLSSMSHEVRTPLNSILGFAQLLSSDTVNPLIESQKESLKRILHAGAHLLELIDEVLDLSKIEAGKLQLSMGDYEADAVIGEALDTVEPMAYKRDVKIIKGDTGKDQYVKADLTRFKQVLLNLLTNAVKYNVPGGKVDIWTETAEDGYFRIVVKDTGKGLPKESMDSLFDPFNRMGAEASNIEGTGIGLTITKKLMEAMGGHIGVESEPGAGSKFFIDLARGEKPMMRDTAESDHGKHLELKNGEKETTVLYIEDNPSNLALVASILKRRPNINLIFSDRARSGIDLARSKKPDMILLDLNLPDMDGYEVLEELRSNGETAGIPVAAVSARAMPDDLRRGKEAGFVRYITKPINVGLFLKAIDDVLE